MKLHLGLEGVCLKDYIIHKRMIQVYTVNSVYGYGPLHIPIDCM
jgi:hypothetical protein